jgi:hypothetical protein
MEVSIKFICEELEQDWYWKVGFAIYKDDICLKEYCLHICPVYEEIASISDAFDIDIHLPSRVLRMDNENHLIELYTILLDNMNDAYTYISHGEPEPTKTGRMVSFNLGTAGLASIVFTDTGLHYVDDDIARVYQYRRV